jgi:hypothetical protein
MARHHDLLLTWLSTVGHADHARARQAAENVEPDRARLAWAVDRGFGELRRAGHVEREGRHWRIVATTLIWRQTCAELYGARDEALAEAMINAGLVLARIPIEFGAEVWRVSGDRRAAEAVCARLGVRCCDDRSYQLLALLPSARSALLAVQPLVRRNPLIGRSWQQFRAPAKWEPEVSGDELGTGLWRSRSPQPFIYLWGEADGSLRRLDRAEHRLLARWLVATESIKLSVNSLGLTVPQYPRLPVLLDRALRIAAGGDVQRRSKDLWYPGIDEGRAAQVARILGASLRSVEVLP